jgi:hypothetical protein
MTQAQAQKIDAEIASMMANTAKLNAETEKLMAEGGKLRMDKVMAPFIAGSGLTLALVAVIKAMM